MQDNLQRYINSLTNPRDQVTLRSILQPVYDRFSSQCFSSAGLAIKTAGSAIVKAGSVIYGIANGVLVTKTANTDMAALSGTVTAATFNVFAFFIDSAGTLTSAMGTAGATLAAVVFPPLPQKKACIGFVVINPTGTGDFVGGTTALDDATVVPNAAYVNVDGPFDPTMVLGS
jgi:hypothetical protein